MNNNVVLVKMNLSNILIKLGRKKLLCKCPWDPVSKLTTGFMPKASRFDAGQFFTYLPNWAVMI